MFLIRPSHQRLARFMGVTLPPKGREDRIPIFDSTRSEVAQVVSPWWGMEANMADHQGRVAQGDSPEEPGVEGRILLKLRQTQSYQGLFLKPLRRNGETKERLSGRGIALEGGLQERRRQQNEV